MMERFFRFFSLELTTDSTITSILLGYSTSLTIVVAMMSICFHKKMRRLW